MSAAAAVLARLLSKWKKLNPIVRRLALFSTAVGGAYWLLGRRNQRPLKKLHDAKSDKVGVNKQFLEQMKKLLPILFPSFMCRETLLLAAHTSCLLARTVASIWLANMDGRIVKALVTGQGRRFLRLLSIWLASAVPIAFVNAAIKFLKNSLALSFRHRLTREAHVRYTRGLTFYQLDQLDGRLHNPDQCITADLAKFSMALADLHSNLSKPMVDIVIFNAQLAYNVGVTGLAAITGLIHTGTLALRYFTPPLGALTSDMQNLEGNFRFQHSRVATNAEEIAFYGGALMEKSYLDEAFDQLRRHATKLYVAHLQFGTLESFIVKYYWGALGFLICALPVFTPFGRPAGSSAADDNMANRTAGFFTNRRILMNTSDAFGRIMGSWRKINELSGYTHRVAQMFDVFDDMEHSRFQRNFKALPPNADADAPREPFSGTGKVLPGEDIEVENLLLVNPTGDVLAENMTFKVPHGTHLFISGPNGCGKSSLFRVIGGLWPVVQGTVRKPMSEKAIFYIPQRPYLSLGTLRDQITYPLSLAEVRALGVTDDDLRRIMDIVKLSYIIENYGGFDAVKNWKDSLSGGEKQRVAMARLFFHKPRFAILDECTSACSIDVEGQIYTEAKKQGISLITVSHRHTLWKYHDYLLAMDGKGGWTFGPMDAVAQQSGAGTVQALTLTQEREELNKRLKEIDHLLSQ